MSPQEIIDCSNGCDGGNAVSVYRNMETKPSVPKWCDPFVGKKDTCGGVCATGVKFNSVTGTTRVAGGFGPLGYTEADLSEGVRQMQLELMKNGPGVVGFEVHDDFQMYSSGVYKKSAGAKPRGWHAVMLVGWGEEKDGKYWLVQNSWGTNVGERGMWKMLRGTNDVRMEEGGLTVVKPEVPTLCPSAKCGQGGELQKDCTCRCPGSFTGSSCEECSLTCTNGGVLYGGCMGCKCPMGRVGDRCEGGYTLSAYAVKKGTKTVTVTYGFPGTATPPVAKSIIGFYKEGGKDSMTFAESFTWAKVSKLLPLDQHSPSSTVERAS